MIPMILWSVLAASAAPITFEEEEEEVEVDLGPTPTATPKPSSSTLGIDIGESEFQVQQGDEDEIVMPDFVAAKLREPPPPVHFHIDPAAHAPFAGDLPLQIVAYGPQHVVVELPLVVAKTRAEFLAAYPHGVRIVADFAAGDVTTAVEQIWSPTSVFEAWPTMAFFQVALPAPAAVGDVRVVLRTAAVPAPADPAAKPPKPAAPADPLKDRFALTTVWMRR